MDPASCNVIDPQRALKAPVGRAGRLRAWVGGCVLSVQERPSPSCRLRLPTAIVTNVGPLSSVQELTNGQDEQAHIGLHVASTRWPMTRCGSAGGGSSCRSHESMVPAAAVSRIDRSYTVESEGKSALPGACVSGAEAQKR